MIFFKKLKNIIDCISNGKAIGNNLLMMAILATAICCTKSFLIPF